jgi:hypothetical protein
VLGLRGPLVVAACDGSWLVVSGGGAGSGAGVIAFCALGSSSGADVSGAEVVPRGAGDGRGTGAGDRI